MSSEELPIGLRWPGGELHTTIVTRRSLWLSMMKGLVVGQTLTVPGSCTCSTMGPRSGTASRVVYIERSDLLDAFPETLRRA